MELVASGNEEHANRIMEKMRIAAGVSQQSSNRISAGMEARDHHMFAQARANIQSLSADESQLPLLEKAKGVSLSGAHYKTLQHHYKTVFYLLTRM